MYPGRPDRASKNRVVVRRLMKKGFDARMSKHIKLVFRFNGCDTGIRIWVSHGTKEISDQLLSCMAEQLNLSRQQFLDLIDCKLDEPGLIAIYEELHLF